MRIFVTGYSSFLGREVLKNLNSMEIDAICIGRNSSPSWSLGDAFPSEFGDTSNDSLIHLAHDRGRRFSQNVSDASKLISSFDGHLVFASSLSAHSRSASIYGRSKFAIEQLIVAKNGAALRIGLIPESDSGFAKRLSKSMRALPFFVFLDKGSSRVFLSPSKLVCLELLYLSEAKLTGVFLSSKEAPTSFAQYVFSEYGKKRAISLPMALMRPLRFLPEIIFVSFPSLDGIRSLVREATLTDISNLRQFSDRLT